MKVLFGSAAISALLIAPGLAADMPVKAAPLPVAAVFSWTGFYIGAHVGLGLGDSTSSSAAPFGAFDDPDFNSITNVPRNAIWGGQIGYNFQTGPAVFGIEGEIGYLGLRSGTIRSDQFASVDFGAYATLTGRIGYAFDRTLFYAKGGGAWARIDNFAADIDGAIFDPNSTTSVRRDRFGWTVGAGVEHALAFAPTWSVKAEYLYMNFGTDRSFDLGGFGYDHRNEVHTFKVGVNYRPAWFGGAPAAAPIVASVYNWTGFYVGVNVGYGLADQSTDNLTPFGGFDEGAPVRANLAPKGFVGGGQAGYNWQAGWAVLGIEAEAGYLGMRKEVTAIDDFTRAEYGWYGVLAGRAGVALDRTLLYAKFGGAWARIRNTASDLDGAPLVVDPLDFSSITKTHFGWAVGAGIEHAFLPNWSLKGEYLYLGFDKVRSFNATPGEAFEHRNEVHTAKIGLNYRFGGTAVVARY